MTTERWFFIDITHEIKGNAKKLECTSDNLNCGFDTLIKSGVYVNIEQYIYQIIQAMNTEKEIKI